MTRYAHVTGWGMAVPQRILTNDEIAQRLDTSDGWIRERTGIVERRIASPEQSTATLAAEAALHALDVAGLNPAEVELIIVATSSPEHIFPATASLVQDMIGATQAGAFDLSAACTGFIYALNMAANAIRVGDLDSAVVVGSETLSRIVDWEDRNTCVLFGDGAGAFVLQASEEPGGVLSTVLRSDGSGGDLLSLPAGGSKLPTSVETVQARQHYMRMKGREVFRFATRVMSQATQKVIAGAHLQLDDIDLIIPHQANQRIIESAARSLKLPLDRFVLNLDRYGNTSTASIPIAACEAVCEARLNPGDQVVLVGFGAGLTWGAMALQWSGPLPERPTVKAWPYRFKRLFGWYVNLRSALLRLLRWIEGFLWGRPED
jgi:3-oxoacyl-[acyl-carrier-protein] synthase-3